MSTLLEGVLRRGRLLLVLSLGLSLLGAVAWLTMPRQEDPSFPERFGVVTVVYPGADAADVERLVLGPVEERLAEVGELAVIDAEARANLAVLSLELAARAADTELAWEEVEEALKEAQSELPDSARAPELRHDLVDTESVIFAVTGSADLLFLTDAAEDLKRKLLTHRGVKRVELSGVQTRKLVIQLSDLALHSIGLDGRDIAAQLASRNTSLAGGTLRASGRTITIDPGASFDTLASISQSPIRTPAGEIVSLSQLGSVALEPQTPASELAHLSGRPAVFLGVVAKANLDTVRFGEELRALAEEARGELSPLVLSELTYQPGRVETRLGSLGASLLSGIGIVALLLLLLMGLRVGLVVASMVPVVALSGLFLYQAFGGVLQQISVAALILALGLVVDNAIVVTESIQRKLDEGLSGRQAAQSSVRELAVPLLSATATTLVAFLPMLLSKGNVGDFTRALPILLMSTLSLSYLFSTTVTPALAARLLRRRASATDPALAERSARGGGSDRTFAGRLARLATGAPKRVVGATLLLVVMAFGFASKVPEQFFPMSDRDQLVVTLELPEGSDLARTASVTQRVEQLLDSLPLVRTHAAFIGRSVPHFYMNLLTRPERPHVAELYVQVADQEAVAGVADQVRQFVQRELVGVRVTPRPLDIGPAVKAPVEIRLLGDDPEELEQAAIWVADELRKIPEARDVSHDLGVGSPTIAYHVSDAAALREGISRSDIALSLLRETRGIPVGQFRGGADPIDISVRTGRGQDMAPEALDRVSIKAGDGRLIPLSQLARKEVSLEPAAVYHHNGRRLASVVAFLRPGATFSQVLGKLLPKLEEKDLGRVRYEVGGGQEKSAEADAALFEPLPLAGFLLILVLLAQFNSLRRVVVVLSTIPLAATGVIPGLLLSGQAFGFMSMLGVFSLVGIVVNAAIVLLDQADSRMKQGHSPAAAMQEAVRLRTRPILLTVLTTVAGLLPLAFSSSPMWPPMAWAMVSGLLASTVLTLLAVPSLYVLLLGAGTPNTRSVASPALRVEATPQ